MNLPHRPNCAWLSDRSDGIDCTCGEAYRAVVIPASIGVEDAVSVTCGADYPAELPDSATIAHAALEALGVPLARIVEIMPDYMIPQDSVIAPPLAEEITRMGDRIAELEACIEKAKRQIVVSDRYALEAVAPVNRVASVWQIQNGLIHDALSGV